MGSHWRASARRQYGQRGSLKIALGPTQNRRDQYKPFEVGRMTDHFESRWIAKSKRLSRRVSNV
jgi:hypothetical protein